MAICANQGRMYMGTARQYMEKQKGCQSCHSMQAGRTVRTLEKGICDRQNEKKENCQCGHSECSESSKCAKKSLCYCEDGCQPESMCMDLPLAMAYMNPQPYTGLVDCDMALSRGSAFNNLYDPWNPGKYC